MNNRTIVFIDDDSNNIDDFKLAGEEFSLEVPTIELLPDINLLVEKIMETNPDAVVVDFKLTETRPDIKYDGSDVLELLESKIYNLPTFIFTSFPSDAEDAADDINIVYDKSDDKLKPLITRITKQIDKNVAKLQEYQIELERLRAIQVEGKLTFKEEERIREIDSYLEKTIDNEAAIAESLKAPSVSIKLSEIFSKMDELIVEMKK